MVFKAESLVTDDGAHHISRQLVENTWIVRDKSGKYRQYPIAVLSPFKPKSTRLVTLFRILPWFLLAVAAIMSLI